MTASERVWRDETKFVIDGPLSYFCDGAFALWGIAKEGRVKERKSTTDDPFGPFWGAFFLIEFVSGVIVVATPWYLALI